MSSKFQSKIIKEYTKLGYKVLKIIKLSENGYTDLLALKDGKAIWIEVKEKTDTLKPLQKLRIAKLRQLGFDAYCLQDGKGKIYPIDEE
jgi:Holliday junction resolvase